MERHEIANFFLWPVDYAIGAAVRTMKKFDVWDPVHKYTYRKMADLMTWQLSMAHKPEIIGEENILKKGGLIFASNHQSWLDAQMLTLFTPRPINFLAKAEFLKWPALRHFLEFTGSIFIKRRGDDSTLEQAAELLREGKCLGIFPEGTIPGEEDIPRSAVEPHTGLLRGKTGMVRMAIRAQVPIIPVGLSGTGLAFPPEAYPRLERLPIAKPEPVTIKYGRPIYFKEYYGKEPDRDTLRSLTNQVMEAISKLVDHSRGFVPIELPVRVIEKHKNLGVLLLHGFTSSLKTVDGLVPYLKKRNINFRMPILRGHGTKPEDLKGVTSQDWYDDAEEAFLDLAREVDKVIVVGLSMGGLLAIELGIRHSDKVAAVVGVAPALKFKDPLSALSPVMAKFIRYWPSPNAFNDKECAKANRNYPKFETNAFVSLYNYSKRIEEMLPRLKVPTLLLHSRKDQIISPRASQVIHDRIGSLHKKIIWFEKSGHEMMQDLEKKAVLKEIDGYLALFTETSSKKGEVALKEVS